MCSANVWENCDFTSDKKHCLNYSNFFFEHKGWENTADLPGIRAYSNKILSNFAKWLTFCLQMMFCYYKNISSLLHCNYWYLNLCYSLVLIYFLLVMMTGFDALCFQWNWKTFENLGKLRLKLPKESFFSFLVFWLQKQPTNMCKLNILVHLKYKWLNVLKVTMSD